MRKQLYVAKPRIISITQKCGWSQSGHVLDVFEPVVVSSPSLDEAKPNTAVLSQVVHCFKPFC